MVARAVLNRRAATRSGKENLQRALLRAPGVLVWCGLVEYHGVPALRSVLDRFRKCGDLPAKLNLPSLLLALLEMQRESIPRLRSTQEAMSYRDLVNRFSFGVEVVRELWKTWNKAKDNQQIFECPPRMLIHLLEESACWAIVLLTQFSNTTLPKSWVQNHLRGSEYLAALAAKNQLPRWPNWRSWVINILAEIIQVAADFVHDQQLPKWAKYHHELPAEMALRLYIIIFSCGTINWLRHIRNEKIRTAVKKNFRDRLALMNRDEKWSPHSLPQMFQWLVMGPPRGKSVAVMQEGEEVDREFDQMTPWFHSVMCGLKDELVLLHRQDSHDSPPGWTTGQRPLEFHRFEHIDEKHWNQLKQYENMWPREHVVIRYPPVRKIYVFHPECDACDFSGIHRSTASVAGASGSHTDTFILDKTANTRDAEEVKADEAAAVKMAVKEKELSPKVEARMLNWLAAIRARLQKRAPSKFEQLCSTSQSFLAKKGANPMQKVMYFRWVVPILNQIHEDSSLKQLKSETLAQKDRMGRQKLDEGEGPMHDLMEVVEVVEKIENQNEAFGKKYEQRILQEDRLTDLDRDISSFRRRRKQLRRDLGQLLRKLHNDIEVDWMHFLLPVMIQNKLREAKKRLEARTAAR